jgi:cytochrome c-type biogenesis protein CcmE
MKTSSIIMLVVIAVSIGVITSMVGDFSSYQTFATATEKAGKQVQIIAYLDTTTHAMEYNPLLDANKFTFWAKDEAGVSKKIVFNNTMPDGFKRSERLTMTGTMKGEEFKCSKILMKCPSKYKNDKELKALSS